MKVAFYTLGCKVNQYESQAMAELFLRRGHQVGSPEEGADVYIINSCTVTAAGDKKTRQAVRRFRRQSPGSVVVLTGCLPQTDPQAAETLPEADVVMGNRDRAGVVDRVEQFLRERERIVSVPAHCSGEAFEELDALGEEGRTRAFLKIQDGCTQFCAYCIIPYARGPLRSCPLEDLRREVRQLAAAGYREVVLTGINLSLYGREQGCRLPDAVEAAASVSGIRRVRIGSLEPELLTDEDIARLAAVEKLCGQFHLSLQSGCDATLARMNRHAGPVVGGVSWLRHHHRCDHRVPRGDRGRVSGDPGLCGGDGLCGGAHLSLFPAPGHSCRRDGGPGADGGAPQPCRPAGPGDRGRRGTVSPGTGGQRAEGAH